MPSPVFPWSAESPIVAGAILLGLAAYLLVTVTGYQVTRRLLLMKRETTPWAFRYVTYHMREVTSAAIFWTLVTSTVYAVLYATTWVWGPLHETIFQPAVARLPALILLGIIGLTTLTVLEVLEGTVKFLSGEEGARPVRRFNPQVLRVLELFLRYIVVGAGIAAAIVVVLDVFGVEQGLGTLIATWFATQANALLLLVTLGGLGWVSVRIIRAITADVRRTNKRFSPEVVDAMGGVAKGVVIAILALIGIITLLTAVGLGSIGGTMIIVLSSLIGLIVAMAATGSIGNALAGIVLVSFKPVGRGDRVQLGDDLVGDVEDVAIMFTRVRNLAGEIVEMPNNQVLAKGIKNLTRSGAHALVVRMGIGYNVSHTLVRKLALEGTLAVEGILREPEPKLYARQFGNYAIEYELYAYTRDPRHLRLRSELLGALQESFHAGGVEIMTPDVHVVRRADVPQGGAVRMVVKAAEPPQPAEVPAASAEVAARGAGDGAQPPSS